jgi:type II secretory pathway pseudopilin PulG
MDPVGSRMRKYYIGLGVIGVFALGVMIFVLTLASANKQDTNTYNKANDISTKLNDYINKNQQIPRSLSDAGIKDAPSSINYTKISDTSFKFCMDYKTSGNNLSTGGLDTLGTGFLAQQALSAGASSVSTDTQSTSSELFIGYTHHKGQNCQTVNSYITPSQFPTCQGGLNVYDSNTQSYVCQQQTQSPSATFPGAAVSLAANDTEREADINALRLHIEAFFADNGYYPTLANLNDPNWRTANMAGLDKEAFRDPSSSSYTLVAIPTAGYYSYVATGDTAKACDNTTTNCTHYELTAKLDNGTSYSKTALN